MENPTFKMEKEGKDTYLTIRCKMPIGKGEAKVSASEKSLLYASTNGNMNTGLTINGENLIAGINVYTRNPNGPKSSKK